MNENNIFEYIGNELNEPIEAFLNSDERENLKIDLIVGGIDQILNNIHVTHRNSVAFKEFKSQIVKIKEDQNAEEKSQSIKHAINLFIDEQVKQQVNLQTKFAQKASQRKKTIIVTIGVTTILLSVLIFQHQKNIRKKKLSEFVALTPDVDTSLYNGDSAMPSLSSKNTSENPVMTNKDSVIINKDSVSIIFPVLKPNPQRIIDGYPIESITIINNDSNPIRISSINIFNVKFEKLLSSEDARELIPLKSYKIELKNGSYKLPSPIEIAPRKAGTIEILFYSKLDEGFIEPFEIGKFKFDLSFDYYTDGMKTHKTSNLTYSYYD